jgi:uncharacterized membrane protein
MLLNPNDEIKKLKTGQDKLADGITKFAGSMTFVYFHSAWFALWILINLGVFGAALIFDDFPYGLLTMIVSLEAIFLSTFVMISQNRQAAAAEIRSELDYKVNVKAEQEIDLLLHALERIAEKQGIELKDIVGEFHDMTSHYSKHAHQKP